MDPTRSYNSLHKCAFFHKVERADGFIYTYVFIRTWEITSFRAWKEESVRHSVSISSEGRAAQPMLCPWQQKHNQEFCDSAFHILWEQTWGHVQQRHYLAGNYHWRTWLTTSSDRSVVFHWLFNYIKIIIKDRKSSILWKTHYPAVYIFSSNTDVSVYYVFLIASYNPCMQHTSKLFMYNYYVASIVVCTTKMTGFYILIYSLPLYISLKDNIHFFRN